MLPLSPCRPANLRLPFCSFWGGGSHSSRCGSASLARQMRRLTRFTLTWAWMRGRRSFLRPLCSITEPFLQRKCIASPSVWLMLCEGCWRLLCWTLQEPICGLSWCLTLAFQFEAFLMFTTITWTPPPASWKHFRFGPSKPAKPFYSFISFLTNFVHLICFSDCNCGLCISVKSELGVTFNAGSGDGRLSRWSRRRMWGRVSYGCRCTVAMRAWWWAMSPSTGSLNQIV